MDTRNCSPIAMLVVSSSSDVNFKSYDEPSLSQRRFWEGYFRNIELGFGSFSPFDPQAFICIYKEFRIDIAMLHRS